MRKFFKKLLFVALFTGLILSCNNDDDIPSGQGAVSVKLTDAPFPFKFVKKATIGIAKVEIKNAEGEYVVVFEGDVNSSFNMVKLTNGATAKLTTTNVGEGIYNEARITLNGASVELSNGTKFSMNSEAQGSYNVSIDPALEVEAGESSDILFDLDVNNSYHFKGSSWIGGWISDITKISGCGFDADFRVCDLDKTGEIKGKVTVSGSSEAGAYVFIRVNGKEIGTHTEANGTYKFIGIKEGNYKVTVKTESGATKSVGNIQVKGTGSAVCNLDL